MTTYSSIAAVCEAAISLSRELQDAIIGVFKNKYGEYYATNDTREIAVIDDCIAEYKNGELFNDVSIDNLVSEKEKEDYDDMYEHPEPNEFDHSSDC